MSQAVSDGAGGAIFVWEEFLSGNPNQWDVYSQRIDAAGFTRWTANGVAVLTLPAGTSHFPRIATDGSRGAIIAWHDLRGPTSNVFAQRIDENGIVLWTANGVALTRSMTSPVLPAMTEDGVGGAIVAYEDRSDIYAQRISAAGSLLWPVDTVVICAANFQQSYAAVVGDGSGGAIIVWEDRRSGSHIDLYAQRVNAAGIVQWATNGVAICTATGEQFKPEIVADGNNGAIVVWQDYRNPGAGSDIYAQRINAGGAVQWTANGVVVAAPTSSQTAPSAPRIASDNNGGAIISWQDSRTGLFQIYAQRVNSAGVVQWTTNGVRLSPTVRSQISASIISDGAGGAIVGWSDNRPTGANYDVYAQRINASGMPQWTTAGAAISTAPQIQNGPQIVSGGAGAIMGWTDFRNSPSSGDIYAQRVLANGTLGGAALALTNPQAGVAWVAGQDTAITWSATGVDFVNISFRTDTTGGAAVFQPVVSNHPAPSGRYVWSVPDTILSRKCAIRIQQSSNGSIVDTSGKFTIKGYVLHKLLPDGNYDRFRFERDRWNFGNAAANMWPMPWYAQFDYQNGIDPNTGRRYPNTHPFNVALSSDFPDWPLFVRAFRVGQCYWDPARGRYKDAALAKWNARKANWSGSCSGFALSSILAFDDSARFRQRFPGMPAFDMLFSVALSDPIRLIVNELGNHWWGKAHLRFVGASSGKTPTRTINDLKQMLWSDVNDHAYLYFWNNGAGGGAHAVVPTKVVQDPVFRHLYWIHVYDNSYHNIDNARIRVDTSANGGRGSWVYALWPGWGGNSGLSIMDRASTYLEPPFLGSRQSSTTVGSDTIQMHPTLGASIIVTDPNGNRIGYSDSVVISEIPGAVALIPPTGSLTPPYSYQLPEGSYRIVMDDFSDSRAQLSIFTDSTAFTYRRSGATLTQTDRFSYDGKLAMRNPDPQSKSITVGTILVIDSTAEKSYTISDCALAQNDSMRFGKDGDDDYRVVNVGPAKTYGLRIEYGSAAVNRLFIHPTVSLSATSSHIIVPNWNNLFQPVRIYIDHGNNGTIDDSTFVQNTVDVDEQEDFGVPEEFTLAQNYPNPFNSSTVIRVGLPKVSFVSLKVYNILGQEVATLMNEVQDAGFKSVRFDASGMASGVYVYRVEARPTDGSAPFINLKKMLLLK